MLSDSLIRESQMQIGKVGNMKRRELLKAKRVIDGV